MATMPIWWLPPALKYLPAHHISPHAARRCRLPAAATPCLVVAVLRGQHCTGVALPPLVVHGAAVLPWRRRGQPYKHCCSNQTVSQIVLSGR